MKCLIKYVGIVLAVLPTSICAQTQFIITANVPFCKGDTVYINYDGPSPNDSIYTTDGVFTFHGVVEAPTYCTLSTSGGRGLRFWLENSAITLSPDENGFIKVCGSQTEDDYQAYCAHMAGIWSKQKEVKKQATDAYRRGELAVYDSLQTYFYETLKQEEDSIVELFIKEHPTSYVSLNHIYNCAAMSKYSYDKLQRFLRHMNTTNFKGYQWTTLSEHLRNMERFLPGRKFPDFTQPDAYGYPVTLSDYRGGYALLTFSGSWNKDYRESNAQRLSLYKKYKDKGFDMLDVLLEEDLDGLIKVVVNDHLPWKLVSECKGWYGKIVDDFGIDHITINYLIDPEGYIIAQDVFGETLSAKLIELLE